MRWQQLFWFPFLHAINLNFVTYFFCCLLLCRVQTTINFTQKNYILSFWIHFANFIFLSLFLLFCCAFCWYTSFASYIGYYTKCLRQKLEKKNVAIFDQYLEKIKAFWYKISPGEAIFMKKQYFFTPAINFPLLPHVPIHFAILYDKKHIHFQRFL